MTAARRYTPGNPETPLQDLVHEVEQVHLTVGQLGVEVQRLNMTAESIVLTLGAILGEIRSLKGK